MNKIEENEKIIALACTCEEKKKITEVEMTTNQKTILRNISTGKNFVFDLYRQSGFTTLMCNYMANLLSNTDKRVTFITDSEKSLNAVEANFKEILIYNNAEFNFGKNKMHESTFTSEETCGMVMFAKSKDFFLNVALSDIVIMDNFAFYDENIFEALFGNPFDTQIIIGSCHGFGNDNGEKMFDKLIRKVKTDSELCGEWFYIPIRWWNDENLVEGLCYRGNFNLTPEMCESITNFGEVVLSNKVIEIYKALSEKSFSREFLNGSELNYEHEKSSQNEEVNGDDMLYELFNIVEASKTIDYGEMMKLVDGLLYLIGKYGVKIEDFGNKTVDELTRGEKIVKMAYDTLRIAIISNGLKPIRKTFIKNV